MTLTKYEQETHASMNREDGYAVIDTANAKHIRIIEKDDRFRVVDRWNDPETGELVGIIAHISLDHFDPITGLKRRSANLSEEERAARGERLAAARAARNAKD